MFWNNKVAIVRIRWRNDEQWVQCGLACPIQGTLTDCLLVYLLLGECVLLSCDVWRSSLQAKLTIQSIDSIHSCLVVVRWPSPVAYSKEWRAFCLSLFSKATFKRTLLIAHCCFVSCPLEQRFDLWTCALHFHLLDFAELDLVYLPK